ncbi:MAG: hypothetical protein ACYDCL_09205 [Myxococcales bacterium]
MGLSRWSLFYLAGYLWIAGLGLLASPHLVFTLMASPNASAYGEVIPRMFGAMVLVVGTFVVQIIRFGLTQFYPTLVGVRLFLLAIWLWLYSVTRDPFFLVLEGIVGFGVALTVAGMFAARRAPSGRGHRDPTGR